MTDREVSAERAYSLFPIETRLLVSSFEFLDFRLGGGEILLELVDLGLFLRGQSDRMKREKEWAERVRRRGASGGDGKVKQTGDEDGEGMGGRGASRGVCERDLGNTEMKGRGSAWVEDKGQGE